MKVILASQSPRRRELIKKVFENTLFETSEADEQVKEERSPEELVTILSERKARAVFDKHPEDDLIVIGSDTVVSVDNTIYGKPRNREDAFKMLKILSGRDHQVTTGVSILARINGELKSDLFTEESIVHFAPLTDKQIEEYIETGDPFDKAGAYGIQSVPEGFIEGVDGDYENVIGLPVKKLNERLRPLMHSEITQF